MRNRRSLLSQINVTPFVDVMLVLLIIFMVTAPMLQRGVEVRLPRVKKVPIMHLKEEPLVVTIKKSGNIFLNSHSLSLDELPKKMKALHVEVPQKRVLIRADGRVAYQLVLKVLAAAKAGGFDQVGLVTAPYREGKR
jgi:biopolymer transport protein TolR